MGTRAVYTFIDDDGSFSVYKHWDNYPKGACEFIENALAQAWPLPRFEADEFASAFVAANKKQPGDVRLTSGPDAHGDLAFVYEVRYGRDNLRVTIFRVGYARPDYRRMNLKRLFHGTLDEARQFASTAN